MRATTNELAALTTAELIAYGRRVGAKAFTVDKRALCRTLAAQAAPARGAARRGAA